MNRHILEKADRHSTKLFQVTENRPQLELLVIDKVNQGLGKWTLEARPRVEINSETELEKLARAETSSKGTYIYTIRRERSWMPLNISRSLFDRLLKLHNVFPEIWKVVLTFGWKRFENEYSFPTLQVSESRSESADTQEVTYVLRQAEVNGRGPSECPWSIRQTGVYQKFTLERGESSGPTSMLLLLTPSREAEKELLRSFAGKTSDNADTVTFAFSAHECLVAESLAGWGDYMCWLEEELKMKSARIMAIPLNVSQENRPLNFNAEDRQSLKEIEFQITDMLVILHTKAGTIRQIKSMRTVQDATAVKLLTLIGLVFLPTTMVENFFSTQFVQTEGGSLQISKHVWVMVAVAVPLTAFVFFCWRVWVRYEYAQLPAAGLTKQRLKRLFRRRVSKTEEATSIA
ncbi:uncharacterized protein BDW70DRAFT_159963 [Aspergillus foveolatus]|uniref:uncharacterized protein n=1 Tax=Aspergillus foveolatus TaxID=210207 RepID=UPI003CCD25CF